MRNYIRHIRKYHRLMKNHNQCIMRAKIASAAEKLSFHLALRPATNTPRHCVRRTGHELDGGARTV
jgi:hypothetical protein